MKKICFVTAARSEYGVLKWLMKDVDNCEELQLQLIVTGGHLVFEQGHTIDQIIEDGFSISQILDVNLDISGTVQIAKAMGRMSEQIAKAFEQLKPDFLVVLGDRYELLSICSTAFIMRIPIIHLSGGDKTEGAIDDGIRNAVTMLAEYHFPGTQDSAQNIIRMKNSDKNVWVVGEPGLDAFYKEKLMNRKELATSLGLDADKKWGLMTYHAETKKSLKHNMLIVKSCIENIIKQDNFQFVITYANADFGGKQINDYIEEQGRRHTTNIKVIPSLGQLRYLSFMRKIDVMIGNSSSGILEAPFLGVPVINIGNRQKGRHQCSNVVQCNANECDIKNAIEKIATLKRSETKDWNYWGDGHTSERVMEILNQELI